MIALFQQEFVQNAFLAGTEVAIMAAIAGYFVVLRGQIFAGESLSHIGFAGATGAFLFGVTSLVGSFIFTFFAALGMGALGERVRGRDVETGMILSFALGLGVLFLGLYASGGNANATVSVLFGSILSVTRQAVLETLGSCLVLLVLLVLLFRPLLFSSIDPEGALARGVPVRLISIMFLLLLALTVAAAIQVVGALLVLALLLAPAATAQIWVRRPLVCIGLAVILSLAFTWSGLLLGFVNLGRQMPVSFSISTLAALSYGVSLLLRRRFVPRRKPQPSACQAERH